MDKSDLTKATGDIRTGWQKYLDEVENTNKIKAAIIAEVKEDAVNAVNEYIAVKDEEKHSLSPEKVAFYKPMGTADLESYFVSARDEALHVIKLTYDSRHIHAQAAQSYDAAMKKHEEAVEASKILSRWQQKVKVTLWDGTAYDPENIAADEEKPVEKKKAELTYEEAMKQWQA